MKSGYMYAADLWCESCGEEICRRILAEGKGPEITCDCGFKGVSEILDEEGTRLGTIAVICPCCQESVPLDPYDYDTDDFPKSEIVDGEADSIWFCAGAEECDNGTVVGTLSDGRPWKIGEWLENDLTDEGWDRFAEAIIESYREQREGGDANPCVKLEADLYHVGWPEAPTECEECEVEFTRILPESATGEGAFTDGFALIEDTAFVDDNDRSAILWRCNWCDHATKWTCTP